MDRTLRLLFMGILAVLGGISAPVHSGTWFDDQTLVVDGQARAYRYYVPDFEPATGYPVLFVLHGGGGSMDNVLRQANAEWPQIADESGILLILPNGVNATTGDPFGDDQHWNDCRANAPAIETSQDDVGYIDTLIEWAQGNFNIDMQRIYAQGGSNGGMMTLRLGSELPHRFAGLAVFIANWPAASRCFGPSHPKSIFICNGDAEDDYMPWDGGCVVGMTAPACRRGTVQSALWTRDFWIGVNGVDPQPAQTIDHADTDTTDNSTVTSDLYTQGPHGIEVMFYRVAGGGHTLPSIAHRTPDPLLALQGLGNQNHDIEGAREAWAFLSRHALEGQNPATTPGRAGTLRVGEVGNQLRFDWIPDCGSGQNYGLYRGNLMTGYSSLAPVPDGCALPGTSATIDAGSIPAEFFLVVPNDTVHEGSYGRSSSASRAAAPTACLPPAAPIDSCAFP